MSEETTGETAPKKTRWPLRVLFFFIAFFISIAIGKAFEMASDPETLASAKDARPNGCKPCRAPRPLQWLQPIGWS